MAADAGTLAGCLFVDYGQAAAKEERSAAETVASQIPTDLWCRTIEFSAGELAGRGSDPDSPRVVAGRNAVLISLGINHASSIGADVVVLGANADDMRDYADCRLDFLRAFDELSRRAYGVRISAGLVGKTKRQIVGEAARLGLDYSLTFSCYCPEDGNPCGKCSSCKQREAALAFMYDAGCDFLDWAIIASRHRG